MLLGGYGPSLFEGVLQTIKISLCTFAIGSVIGLIFASLKLSGFKPLLWIANIYTTLIRGIPELLVLLMAYFGGTALISQLSGEYYEVNPFVAGVFSLSIIFGGYSTEIFRGSFQSVPRGLIEAGESFGFSKVKMFFRLKLPLAIRYAIPGLSNLWLVLLKETALVSIIGMEDLMRKTQIAVGATKEPFTFYLIAALMYLTLTFLSQKFLKSIESYTHRGVVGA